MALHQEEFERIVLYELTSDDADVKRLGLRRLHILMSGEPAADEDAAKAKVTEMCHAILAALA
jgi:hypothetical protein